MISMQRYTFTGYSVESGYFFKKDQLLFVSGAPGWHYVGTVINNISKLYQIKDFR